MATRLLQLTIEGVSAYSQSKHHDEPKLDKESADAYEKRTWLHKAHVDPQTKEVIIPGSAIKKSISEAARRLAIKIPGKNRSTYGKNIKSGVLILEDPSTGIKITDVKCETVHCHANGNPNSGSRVYRSFPIIPRGWQTKVEIAVIDDEIPNDVVERCIVEAGSLIGIGRYRPENGGTLGRFKVVSFDWSNA
jgi:hypothetical protein